MDRDLQIWLIVFVATTAIAVTIQLAALCYAVWRLQTKVKEIERRAQSQRSVFQEMVTTARELLVALKHSVDSAAEVSERIKGVANQAAEFSQQHLGRADRVIDNVLTRVERISESFDAGATK